MLAGLSIEVVNSGEDYLGLEIRGGNQRYAGTTRIYAGPAELSEFAALLSGFPRDPSDHVTHEFGHRAANSAGGYCRFELRCLDQPGQVVVTLRIDEDKHRFNPASAEFRFLTEPLAIDQFVHQLHDVEREKFGTAHLSAPVHEPKLTSQAGA